MFFKRKELGIGLGLFLLTLGLFLPAVNFRSICLDEDTYVYKNPLVLAGLNGQAIRNAFTQVQANSWHPVTWISYQLDYSLFGNHAGGFHFTNLLLHSLNTLLVFGLVCALSRSPWPAALVAALFGWHPLHVESVAWIAERKDVLSMFFLLLTLASYAWYARKGGSLRFAITLLLFALGLMSKAILVSVPAALLLLDYWPLNRVEGCLSLPQPPPGPSRSWLWLVAEKLPFLLLAFFSALITRLCFQSNVGAHTPFAIRFWNAPVAIGWYLLKGLWPSELCLFYPLPARPPLLAGLLLFAVLAVVSALVVKQARRSPWLVVGWGWFLVTLLPVLNLAELGLHARADRYTYIPFLGLFVAGIWQCKDWVARQPLRRMGGWTLCLLGLLACLGASHRQLGYWRDSLHVTSRVVAVTHDNPIGQYLYGLSLAQTGRFGEAARAFRESYRLFPTPRCRYNLALTLEQAGAWAEAETHFAALCQAAPQEALLQFKYGETLAQQHKDAQARDSFAQALRLNPSFAAAHYQYARSLQRLGEAAAAAAGYSKALELHPAWPECQEQLAYLLALWPQADRAARLRALELAKEALRPSQSSDPFALRILGLCQAAQGEFAPAANTVRAAQKIAEDSGLSELAGRLQGDLTLFCQQQMPTLDWRAPADTGQSPPPLSSAPPLQP